MPPDSRRRSVRELPRHYWPIVTVWLLLWVVLGAALGGTLGINPYISAGLASGAMLLWEVYRLRRAGY